MTAKHKKAIYKDETKAREHLETLRWPDGAYCPRCGGFEVTKLGGKAADLGQYNCRDCRKKFTVTVGTVFERSHIPLTTWLFAFHLMASSKKGMSSHQLHRLLGVTYKTAWFMAHRIREAMAPAKGSLAPMGGAGKVVEADETYQGKTKETRTQSVDGRVKYQNKGRGGANKRAVIALVERGGSARTFHVAHTTFAKVEQIVSENIHRESRLHTDESRLYSASKVPGMVAEHETVRHSADEYVRGDVYSNSAENYFSIFKRGMRGVYQHCSEKHLHRYLAEFDFRYSNRIALGVDDTMRANEALKGIAGKRLTYRRTSEALL
jgi:transposase-like protein